MGEKLGLMGVSNGREKEGDKSLPHHHRFLLTGWIFHIFDFLSRLGECCQDESCVLMFVTQKSPLGICCQNLSFTFFYILTLHMSVSDLFP